MQYALKLDQVLNIRVHFQKSYDNLHKICVKIHVFPIFNFNRVAARVNSVRLHSNFTDFFFFFFNTLIDFQAGDGKSSDIDKINATSIKEESV